MEVATLRISDAGRKALAAAKSWRSAVHRRPVRREGRIRLRGRTDCWI